MEWNFCRLPGHKPYKALLVKTNTLNCTQKPFSITVWFEKQISHNNMWMAVFCVYGNF